MTNLERMEKHAVNHILATMHITPVDDVCVVYNPEWVESDRFEYLHNGVRIERDRAFELVI